MKTSKQGHRKPSRLSAAALRGRDGGGLRHLPRAGAAPRWRRIRLPASDDDRRSRRHRHPQEHPGLDRRQEGRDSSIVEVVSAEDIGKLPDSSIAESIARLPGIAAQRTNGRAQTLSIRGLGPDFTVTTFNGREQASTNDNRTVEFDQYPSELVTQVKIYKTPDAGMAYQGIAGTTDIRPCIRWRTPTAKLAVGYKREMNEQEANIPGLPDAGDRANLTYIDQFTGQHARRRARCRVQQDAVPGADARALGLRGLSTAAGHDGHRRRQGRRAVVVLQAQGVHGRGRVQAQRQPAHAARCLPLRLQGGADHPAHGVRHDLGESVDDARRIRARSKTAACSRARSPTCRSWSSRTTTTTATRRSTPSA